MSDEWFYKHVDHIMGPLSAAELRQHALSLWITPEDNVRRGADGKWVLAAKVKGLFDPPPAKSNRPTPETTSGLAHQATPTQKSAHSQSVSVPAAEPPCRSTGVTPSPSVPLNWVVGGGIALILLFVIVLVVAQSSGSIGAPSNASPSVGEYAVPSSGGSGSSAVDDSKSLREKAVRAEIESLRFEVTQMQEKEHDLQHQIDVLEADKRRADDELRRVRDPVNNQVTYFAISRRSQDLSLEIIRKAVEKSRFHEDIRRKKSKLTEAESTLRGILNP